MPSNVDKISDALSTQFPNIVIAIVFGSFGSKRENAQSDVDLAVASKIFLTDDEKIKIIEVISSVSKRQVDLIDLKQASGTVLKEALTTGSFLFNRDPDLLASILSRMLTDESDFQSTRRRLSAEARMRIFNV